MRATEFISRNAHHVNQVRAEVLILSEQWQLIGYLLFTLGIVIEGDAVLFTAGFLSHQGLFHPVLMFIWLLAGSTVGDLAWYRLGAWLQGKNNWLVRWLKKVTNPLGPHLLERPKRSLFLSKFLYGINHAILCIAGALGLPIKEFVRDDLPGNIAWILIIGGLGYASSAGIVHLGHSIRYAEIGLLAGIGALMIISRTFTHFFKKKL